MEIRDQTCKGKRIFFVLSYFKFSEAEKGSVCRKKEKLVLDKASTESFDVLNIEKKSPNSLQAKLTCKYIL